VAEGEVRTLLEGGNVGPIPCRHRTATRQVRPEVINLSADLNSLIIEFCIVSTLTGRNAIVGHVTVRQPSFHRDYSFRNPIYSTIFNNFWYQC
jgi:hypothetical protein